MLQEVANGVLADKDKSSEPSQAARAELLICFLWERLQGKLCYPLAGLWLTGPGPGFQVFK